MTRAELLKVFTIQGGISTPRQRTFVSRDCPYFKVDMAFQLVPDPNREPGHPGAFIEDARDVIAKISRPYLEFMVTD